jgi:hypothetical protein
MGGSPPVMILSGWPAVWVSIVKKVFENLNAIPPALLCYLKKHGWILPIKPLR